MPLQKTFRPYDQHTLLLMPPSLHDWVADDGLVAYLNDLGDELQTSIERGSVCEVRSTLTDRVVSPVLSPVGWHWGQDRSAGQCGFEFERIVAFSASIYEAAPPVDRMLHGDANHESPGRHSAATS